MKRSCDLQLKIFLFKTNLIQRHLSTKFHVNLPLNSQETNMETNKGNDIEAFGCN